MDRNAKKIVLACLSCDKVSNIFAGLSFKKYFADLGCVCEDQVPWVPVAFQWQKDANIS